ncbi:YetF domain-containing protein [Sphingomicrobium sp. XHP0239]|uniref:DUF421 domain-containing protein n=1 Tax=Sphingomicrobium maritimum TaxID=3133972 RepID=UPI0031CCC7DF
MSSQSAFWFAEPGRNLEVVAGGVLLFAFAVILGRLLGKRSMAQMNNFDWLIAVASGSILASGVLAKDIALASAALAMATLGACQWIVTKFFAQHPDQVDQLKADPKLLLHKGIFLERAMQDARVSKDEIFSRLRAEGMVDPAQAQWVIMEPDGALTVIARRKGMEIGSLPSLRGVVYNPDLIDEIERDHRDEIAESETRFAEPVH